ncbi:phytoene desaturase family protein [Halobacillus salinus]|uniref:4,4'-diaponeurosporene oxygenase n=1 Tax=Halobacillus salinus TaxID=192814 RepID=A0A4Z0H4T5_9BACI|nr:phytoene desaturase family protein [Halobacillus salinus]TGB05110.1 phytoene desaturase [Halobacillus salinus]
MKVAIVGGGLGGLSAAVTLAKHGLEVDVYEKNHHFGGKMMAVDEQGYHFDFGPNTMTMPEVFCDVVRQGGLIPEEELEFIQLERHTRNQFPDGTVFDLSSNPADMKEQLEAMDQKGAARYDRFLDEVERLYDLSKQHFLHRTFSSWSDYLSPGLAKALAQVRPWQSMDRFFHSYFSNPKIIQSLNRYSTYVGSSPFTTPATFAMIAHLELNDGVYYVRGGNTNIAKSFVKAARRQGARLHNNQPVRKVLTEGNTAVGIELESGEQVEADYVLINGDLLEAVPKLLGQDASPSLSKQKLKKIDPSISAFVIMAGLDTKLDQLHHHHVLFSNDYKKEFNQLQKGRYADDPTIYLCTSSKSDPSVSPEGDNTFLLVNAPALEERNTQDDQAYKQLIYNKLKRNGIPLESHVKYEKVITPKQIADMFGAYKGSLYGPSSNRKLQAFMRPFNKSKDVDNLFFCGGSTHPGGGSPMVVLSGQNVANEMIGKLVNIE